MAFSQFGGTDKSLGGLFDAYTGALSAGQQYTQNNLINDQQAMMNQRRAYEDPMELLKQKYNLSDAEFKDKVNQARLADPNSARWALAGEQGTQMTQDAQGSMAQSLFDPMVKAKRQELDNQYSNGEITSAFYKMKKNKLDSILSGNIGFPMQGQGDMSGTSGFDFKPNYGNEGRGQTSQINDALLDSLRMVESGGGKNTYNKESGATGDFQFIPSTVAEIRKTNPNFDPNDPVQAREEARKYLETLLKKNNGDIRKALKDYGGFVTKDPTDYINKVLGGAGTQSLTSRFAKTDSSNPWLSGMSFDDPQYNAVRGLAMDTPEFAQKMAQGEEKNQTAIELAEMRAQAMRERDAVVKKIGDPKYKEEQAKYQRIIATAQYKASQGIKPTEDEFIAYQLANNWMEQHRYNLQVSSGRNFQQGFDMSQMTDMPMAPSPVQAAKTNAPGTALPGWGGAGGGQPTGNVVKYDNKGNRIQ